MIDWMVKVDDVFAEWAQLKSGCSGGNPNGAIWLCGIEWGGEEEPPKARWKKEIENLKKSPPAWEIGEVKMIFDDLRKYQFDNKAFKLLGCLCADKILIDFDSYDFALKNITYTLASEFFRMNLYPISFPDTSGTNWQSDWYLETGLPTKAIYKLWCQSKRFPAIREWVSEGAPRLIICVGKSYVQEFIMAFEGLENIAWGDGLYHETILERDLTWLRIREGRTVLCVVPFMNNYQLNSDARLEAMGLRIREICDAELGRDWLPDSLRLP